ncbi:MAG: tRNA dihydrouridine synthase DusB [Verrucomicrobiales bacterium]|nr:tRNA dihydrouridine synthase DusB [Verrucomicrobiales bacterium]
MLPWFQNDQFPLYLAPMAGVTNLVFRRICKELGADVMVTEFVSAEGIIQADQRTRRYTEFEDEQRPVGVQLFGADGSRMAEAARKIIDWKEPDFIDINFGCPVNKVVSKNGGSSLLRDCPVLADVAEKIAKGVGDQVPVTAKIRIGWDADSINAPDVCTLLEESGMQAIAIHGRTRSQGYSGEADWEVIDECSRTVSVPVVGNGDISTGQDVELRKGTTGVSGVMIGRAAMQHPWVFQEAKHYLETGEHLPPVTPETRWELIIRHARMLLEWNVFPNEKFAMQSMRSRLMAYSRGLRNGKKLRVRFSTVETLSELEDIAAEYLAWCEKGGNESTGFVRQTDPVGSLTS